MRKSFDFRGTGILLEKFSIFGNWLLCNGSAFNPNGHIPKV